MVHTYYTVHVQYEHTCAVKKGSNLQRVAALQEAIVVVHLEGSAWGVVHPPTHLHVSAQTGFLYRDDPSESMMGGGVRLLADGTGYGCIWNTENGRKGRFT